MKLPPNILNAKGRAAKGTVTLSSARSEPPVYLQEFGHKLEGTTLTCYALTAPGDIINLDFAFNPCTAEFCDIIVDGVRRKTTTIPSSSKYVYRSSFDRVLFSSRTANKRSAIKNCRMQVKAQDHSEDIQLDENSVPSPVGSIILQLFRRDLPPDGDRATDDETKLPPVERYPDFEECANWQEVPNHNIFHEADIPSLEIDLVEGTKGTKQMKDKTQKVYSSEYKLLTTLVFLLRTTKELRKMENIVGVPDYLSAGRGISVEPLPKKGRSPSKSKSVTSIGSAPHVDDHEQVADDYSGDESRACTPAASAMQRNDQVSGGSVQLADGKEDTKEESTVFVDTNSSSSKHFVGPNPALKGLCTAGAIALNTPKHSKLASVDSDGGLFVKDADETYYHSEKDVSVHTTTMTEKPKSLHGTPEAPAAKAWKARNLFIKKEYTYDDESSQVSSSPPWQSVTSELTGNPATKKETQTDNERNHRAPSFISDAPTESTDIAPLEEILAATKKSYRPGSTSNVMLNSFGNYSLKGITSSEIANSQSFSNTSTSQELGSPRQFRAIHTRLLNARSGSVKSNGRSPSPAATGKMVKFSTTHQAGPAAKIPTSGSTNSTEGAITNTTISSTIADKDYPVASVEVTKPVQKRKASEISKYSSASPESHRSLSSPASRERIERDLAQAKARVKAAEARKKQLVTEYEAALWAKQEREEVLQMAIIAEEIERENADMEAKIAALYGSDDGVYETR